MWSRPLHRPRIAWLVVAALVAGCAVAVAAPAATIAGRVGARDGNAPVAGVTVLAAGPDGTVRSTVTGRTGRYRLTVPPGTHDVLFVNGGSRAMGRITVDEGERAVLDTRIGNAPVEVIELEDVAPPAVMPKVKDKRPPGVLPPYSDDAVLTDAWTRAWLLLDVSPQGQVTAVKLLGRPGHDLDDIAVREAFALTFEPARDRTGRPVRAWMVWGIEWPANSWVVALTGVRTRLPPDVGFPPRPAAWSVPCAGSGPMRLDSIIYKGYRDCSQPDLSRADQLPWITRP